MVRLRVSWPFSLSSAPTVGNPCRPLQPESVSCTASRKIRSFRPLAPRRERQARNTSSTVAQSSSVIRVSMVGSSQTDLPGVTDPRTWESTHRILDPIRPHRLERALSEGARPGAARKLSGQEEALLVATACSSPPEGRARWTRELLAGDMVRLTPHDSLSRDTVRRRLAENELKPWREKMWCVPHIDGEFVARMEDVLDLYAEPPDPKCPVGCLDESPLQLIGEVREPVPAAPGRPVHYDYKYRRCGTVNLFVVMDVHRPWRKVTVTERRTAQDYAARLLDLVDVDYPEAERMRVVQDNLSTHTPGALYEAFPAAEARRILRRLEFHYAPQHASWLNMVEIEIGVLKGQCPRARSAAYFAWLLGSCCTATRAQW